jgi:hypothetical protein
MPAMVHTGGSSWEPITAWCGCTEEAIIGLPSGDIPAASFTECCTREHTFSLNIRASAVQEEAEAQVAAERALSRELRGKLRESNARILELEAKASKS